MPRTLIAFHNYHEFKPGPRNTLQRTSCSPEIPNRLARRRSRQRISGHGFLRNSRRCSPSRGNHLAEEGCLRPARPSPRPPAARNGVARTGVRPGADHRGRGACRRFFPRQNRPRIHSRRSPLASRALARSAEARPHRWALPRTVACRSGDKREKRRTHRTGRLVAGAASHFAAIPCRCVPRSAGGAGG